ncbi:MAG: response regulator [Pyrinomonadaceae bacterium]
MSELRPKILYIDDDLDALKVMTLYLDLRSIEVVSARSCADGLVRAAGEHFDLFLLDTSMPGTDGFDLCRQLRRLYPERPTIFYTGRAHDGQREEAMTAGATEFVAKPNFDSLLESLSRYVTVRA